MSLARQLGVIERAVLQALVLGATMRPRSWVTGLVGRMAAALGARDEGIERLTQEQLKAAFDTLTDAGWLQPSDHRPGYWCVAPERWAEADADLRGSHDADTLMRLLCLQEGIDRINGHVAVGAFRHMDMAVSVTRLLLYGGAEPAQLTHLRNACGWTVEWDSVFERAVLDVADDQTLPHLHPQIQAQVLAQALADALTRWIAPPRLALPQAALDWLAAHEGQVWPEPVEPVVRTLRTLCAEHLTLAGRADEAQALLAPLAAVAPGLAHRAGLLDAVAHSARGAFAEAETLFNRHHAALRKLTQQRKGLLNPLLATFLVQAQMAQHTAQGGAARLQAALKFCQAEGAGRSADPQTPWGVMALALQMRLGDLPRDLRPLRLQGRPGAVVPNDWWVWLMRAWLHERGDVEQVALQPTPAEWASADALRERLLSAGLTEPAAQLDGALAVLRHADVPARFFVPAPQDGWQVALAALAALAGSAAEPEGGTTAAPSETRMWWRLTVDDDGALLAVVPFEQKLGPRGWGKSREVPLVRLVQAQNLLPHDAAVVRAIRKGVAARDVQLDRAVALLALVGHPCVDFDDAPERAVQLVEASPELEVIEHGEDLLVRLQPPLRSAGHDPLAGMVRWSGAATQKEAQALLTLTVLRDEPQRARLVRYTPAQQRAAQLIGLGLTVPRHAAAQLQGVLKGLGAHFQIHADEVAASRELPTDSRLRAELSPEGAGVRLRLVVAPLGPEGPRLTPGSGRQRLIAAIGGETLGAQRDLAAERSHLETVIDACPMLAPLPVARSEGQVVPALWSVDDAEAALALVERLHTLNAVAALDWPQGKAMQVDRIGLGQFSVQVQSGQEWLALQGGIEVDEQLVASLSRLLDWAATTRSRFMPLGDGRFLALTEALRSRIDDLAAVSEPLPRSTTGGLRLPAVAAGWLAAALDEAALKTDAGFQDRLETLLRARHWEPALPATLQAELRPYQLEGYQWAMRLAEAGLGAVLADDMGLGKTLQAIAVLLARAAGGAALVLAPTSLIGNWAAELRRFAPSLNVRIFAEDDREAVLAEAGAGDVVLISYQLQFLHAEAFAARRWHTLVLDEAQAIKNAAAKRTQAAFELAADFRLALSGTPIENRLAELWSLMRVCNPGLLGTPAQFNARFAVPIERDRQRGAQRTLRRLIQPFVLRRTKAEVLDDLPPRTERVLRVQGNESELAHYEALRRQALQEAQEALRGATTGQAHLNILAQLTRLRRAACDPRLVTPDLRQPGAKVQAFGELARELVANGHKALVFSQFVDFLGLLREPLDEAGITYQYLDGSTPAPERSRRVAAFQAGEGSLFLISLKAGGFGLNLTVADYVVIADPWWNPAAEDQASGRAHRIGQQRPVTVYRLVNAGTLEETIVALHERKRELADSVLAAPDEAELAAQAEAAHGAPFKVDELIALMRAEPAAEE
ncbi:DEAD/DEAH box helicase [Leptothrix sp. BB-4]